MVFCQVIPILRAGLVLVEHISSVLPATQTYHVGMIFIVPNSVWCSKKISLFVVYDLL